MEEILAPLGKRDLCFRVSITTLKQQLRPIDEMADV